VADLMTLFFPDVSQYTPNVDVTPYPIVLARATLSDRIADSAYAAYKQKSAGKVFVAYHWLNHGNLAAQARWCFQHVGPDVAVMIDGEDVSGNTGYNGPLTVDDLLGFTAQYRALGGRVSLVYLPYWYWSGPMGAPHRLGELSAAGLGLVSSNYPNAGYTENGPGWAPYYSGAPAPVQWQYTSTPIDMNAFRGSVDDFRQLIGDPVAFFDDPNAAALAWRVAALQAGTDTVTGGPVAGEPMWLVTAVKQVLANQANPAPVAVDADAVAAALVANTEFLAALAKAVNDDAARRLQE
jgi:hypothetical protein